MLRRNPEIKMDTVPSLVFSDLIIPDFHRIYLCKGLAKINPDWWAGRPNGGMVREAEVIIILYGDFSDPKVACRYS